jgi:hypothetical protein
MIYIIEGKSSRSHRSHPTILGTGERLFPPAGRTRVEGASEVRLLFVFDAAREAIILVAGDKAGRWSGWYAEAIPLAEERYAVYQRENREKEQQ